jgi:hypothetical protein
VRYIDWERGRILVRSSIVQLYGKPLFEKALKSTSSPTEPSLPRSSSPMIPMFHRLDRPLRAGHDPSTAA